MRTFSILLATLFIQGFAFAAERVSSKAQMAVLDAVTLQEIEIPSSRGACWVKVETRFGEEIFRHFSSCPLENSAFAIHPNCFSRDHAKSSVCNNYMIAEQQQSLKDSNEQLLVDKKNGSLRLSKAIPKAKCELPSGKVQINPYNLELQRNIYLSTQAQSQPAMAIAAQLKMKRDMYLQPSEDCKRIKVYILVSMDGGEHREAPTEAECTALQKREKTIPGLGGCDVFGVYDSEKEAMLALSKGVTHEFNVELMRLDRALSEMEDKNSKAAQELNQEIRDMVFGNIWLGYKSSKGCVRLRTPNRNPPGMAAWPGVGHFCQEGDEVIDQAQANQAMLVPLQNMYLQRSMALKTLELKGLLGASGAPEVSVFDQSEFKELK